MHRENVNWFPEVICAFWRMTIVLELYILLWSAPAPTPHPFSDMLAHYQAIRRGNIRHCFSISQNKHCNKLPWVCRLYIIHWVPQMTGVQTWLIFSFFNVVLGNRNIPQVCWKTQVEFCYLDVRQMLGVCKHSVSQSINAFLARNFIDWKSHSDTLHSFLAYFKCFCHLVMD